MADDPFINSISPSELDSAADILSSFIPFLTKGLCSGCSQTLTDRIRSLRPDPDPPAPDPHPQSPKVRMSWADMASQEDELEEEEEAEENLGKKKKMELTREQREWIRFNSVKRKKDFICLERVRGRGKDRGKLVNILDGLELHTGVFSAAEQKRIVDEVYDLQEKGMNKELQERTYTAPQKWMPGKGRVTIQFGCCYNYATDKNGNPPGIIKDVTSDRIPDLFKVIIKRLIRWHVLPPSCVPDSCIVNIYEPGDCIPPHIDSHDFLRPFTTVSFLSECNILFGTELKPIKAGEFSGSTAIPLPVGSVLVINGNAADVSKHCVPAVPTKRISITFRKMDPSKHPYNFKPERDLQNIQVLQFNSPPNPPQQHINNIEPEVKRDKKPRRRPNAVPQTPGLMRPRQVIVNRSASSSRSFEAKPRMESQDVRLLRDDNDVEYRGRTVRLEQKRMIISRSVDQE